MDNNQIKFLGACIILGFSILAITDGLMLWEDGSYSGREILPGLIGIALALYIGIPAWRMLNSSKDK